MRNLRIVLVWLLGISFIVLGILKYISLDEMSQSIFERANYPKWFFYVIATVEFVSGILLLMTATTSRRLGSILIGIIMIGAIGTRLLIKDHFSHFVLPGIVLALAIFTSLDFHGKNGPVKSKPETRNT